MTNKGRTKIKLLKSKLLVYLLIWGLVLLLGAWTFNKYTNSQKMSLKVGSKIPEFSLPDQDGNLVNIMDFVGKNNLVIYFYPKDDTPGCTAEACSFRDQFAVFRDSGAEVFGISSDNVAKHKAFAEKHRLPFRLLSDVNKRVRKLFGVPSDLLGLLPGRVTYIVDKSGTVSHIFNSQFNAEKHVSEALEVLKNLE